MKVVELTDAEFERYRAEVESLDPIPVLRIDGGVLIPVIALERDAYRRATGREYVENRPN